jgi:RNA polymerase sigma factor (sigma-70 family)
VVGKAAGSLPPSGSSPLRTCFPLARGLVAEVAIPIHPVPPQDPETATWFSTQVQPHEPALRAYLHGFVQLTDIDDLVQETYVRLLKARERGPIGSPRGLLFATARNATYDLFRRRAVAQTSSVAEIDCSRVFDEAPGVAETVSRRQETDLLEAAIKTLPHRCREILVLRKFHNLSHREIARKLGISEHTVEAQLTKALHRCEEFFARHGALPP